MDYAGAGRPNVVRSAAPNAAERWNKPSPLATVVQTEPCKCGSSPQIHHRRRPRRRGRCCLISQRWRRNSGQSPAYRRRWGRSDQVRPSQCRRLPTPPAHTSLGLVPHTARRPVLGGSVEHQYPRATQTPAANPLVGTRRVRFDRSGAAARTRVPGDACAPGRSRAPVALAPPHPDAPQPKGMGQARKSDAWHGTPWGPRSVFSGAFGLSRRRHFPFGASGSRSPPKPRTSKPVRASNMSQVITYPFSLLRWPATIHAGWRV